MIAAFGLHETLAYVEDPLKTVPAFGLLAGVALYLLGHVLVRLRHVRTLNRQRLGLAVILLALVPLALEVASLATLVIVTVALCVMIPYETRRYGEPRARLRWAFDHEGD